MKALLKNCLLPINNNCFFNIKQKALLCLLFFCSIENNAQIANYVTNGGGRNNHIQDEIIALKAQLKEKNKLLSTLEKFERIKQSNKWMAENHRKNKRLSDPI